MKETEIEQWLGLKQGVDEDYYKKHKHKYKPMDEATKIKMSETLGGTDEYNINMFKSLPQYTQDDIFERVWTTNKGGSRRSDWVYTCSRCSKDKYALDGCSSSYKVTKQYLKGDKKPCRCEPNHRYTKEEKGFNLKWMCADEGIIFKGFVDSDSSSQHFKWVCTEGHETSCRVSSFVNEGRRCRYCRDDGNGINGYYKDKIEHEDFLYILLFSNFIKVGRSFSVNSRVYDITRYSKEKPSVVVLYTNVHQKVYDMEQEIHSILREKGFQMTLTWTNECFKLESLEVVLSLLENQEILIKYED